MKKWLSFLSPRMEGSVAPRVIGPADPTLLALVIGLIAFGVVMVFSASAFFADSRYDDPFRFLIRQGVFASMGVLIMLVIARFDYHRYRALTYPALAGVTGLLLIVALGFGRSAGGAARWIPIGPLNVQPAEIAKLVLILWMAYSLSKKRDQIRSFQIGFLPHLLVSGILALLCLKQPDLGSAVVMMALTFVMLFAAGARVGYLLGAGLMALPIVYLLIATSPYRMRRIQAFLEPFEHRLGIGYQITESLISFGAGGATGVGLGDGRQKLLYLPEAHTDFISAIIGEELGFVGIVCLLFVFVAIVWRGVRAAMNAANDYGTYMAFGITFFLGMQAFTNLAVAMGLVPTKGLVLPFISYGGSSLLVNCAAVGILLNISRAREGVARMDEDVPEEAGPVEKKAPRATRRRSRKRNHRLGEAGVAHARVKGAMG